VLHRRAWGKKNRSSPTRLGPRGGAGCSLAGFVRRYNRPALVPPATALHWARPRSGVFTGAGSQPASYPNPALVPAPRRWRDPLQTSKRPGPLAAHRLKRLRIVHHHKDYTRVLTVHSSRRTTRCFITKAGGPRRSKWAFCRCKPPTCSWRHALRACCCPLARRSIALAASRLRSQRLVRHMNVEAAGYGIGFTRYTRPPSG